MEKRKNKPCKKHKIAFGSWKMTEIEAMSLRGKSFTKCSRCGWIILNNLKDEV